MIAWITQYVNNYQPWRFKHQSTYYITVHELNLVEIYLFSVIQVNHFSTEIDLIKSNQSLPIGNCLLPFSPFIDLCGLLRVGGRQWHAKLPYTRMHPVILHGEHPLIIISEHKHLLYARPTLMIVNCSLFSHHPTDSQICNPPMCSLP